MIKQNFFVIDSNRLNEVDTAWYGYMVTPTGIYDWDNAPGRVNKDMLSGLGAYVFIDRQQEQIDIYQDHNGSWGLCFYQNDGKFVISNSVLLLIEYLSGSVRLTLNREYAYYLMGNPLSDMMLEDTIVSEIKLIESGAVIHIDISQKRFSIESPEYNESIYSLDSIEGLDALDIWYNKWADILSGVTGASPLVMQDLSGGMDTRLAFTVSLGMKAGLSGLKIRSYTDKIHTHAEDYEIASAMTSAMGLKLNEPCDQIRYYELDPQETIDKNFYSRLSIHKELFFIPRLNITKQYRVTGDGGEAIRGYSGKTKAEYISEQKQAATLFEGSVSKEMADAIASQLNRDYARIHTMFPYLEEDSALTTTALFRRTYNRSHFGRNCMESCISNVFRLEPIIDPDLYKVRLTTQECSDPNLLYTLILVRYSPKVLDYPFEGGRRLDPNTVAYAKELCRKHPYHADSGPRGKGFEMPPSIRQSLKAYAELPTMTPKADAETIKSGILEEFLSERTRITFTKVFDKSLYEYAERYVKEHKYFPLRECNAVLAIVKVLDMID
ncbi:MAG: hypothetical protein E7300_07145 [Lachnospiraceae bacterium]|nr:hypothetical protein [Lachnospiraceae bacterium]